MSKVALIGFQIRKFTEDIKMASHAVTLPSKYCSSLDI